MKTPDAFGDAKNPSLPQMQFAIAFGDISPDSENNVFGDYQKVITFSARRVDEKNLSDPGQGTDSFHFLFGSREGKSYMKFVLREEAERIMVETFKAGMGRAFPYMIEGQPAQPSI